MTGCDKNHDERTVVKAIRKMFKSELADEEEIPLKAVAKKRGNTHCFLQFADNEQKKRFEEIFAVVAAPSKRMNLRDAFGVKEKYFKAVRDAATVMQENRDKINAK